MPKTKEEKAQSSVIWLQIDFYSVKRRIEEINSQIERVLLKYQIQISDELHDEVTSEGDDS
jgi:cell division protein FtsL